MSAREATSADALRLIDLINAAYRIDVVNLRTGLLNFYGVRGFRRRGRCRSTMRG